MTQTTPYRITLRPDCYCPYCGKGQEICHDDGYGYAEDKDYEQECADCEKTFLYTTSIHFHYETREQND